MPTSDPTAAAMAVEALQRLGRTAGTNPVGELFGYTDQISAHVQQIRDQMHATDTPPADPEEYARLCDALLVALVAGVHVADALEVQDLEDIYRMPYPMQSDEDE